jgi:bifunctional non-homologous end joining protein LigD
MVQYVREIPSPRFFEPMKCLPVERLPGGDKWVYEVKWDGYRTLAVRDGKTILLYSDRGNSHTEKFPGIVLALAQLSARRFVLDGEVVALNNKGVPDFQQLQNWKTTRQPIVYYVFDILHLEGRDLVSATLSERRQILEKLAKSFREPLMLSEQFRVDVDSFVSCIKARGLEGVVAKRAESVYEAGKRTGAWQKKRFGMVENFTIGGFVPGPNGVDEILVGNWRAKKLYYINSVRAGLVQHTREMLHQALKPLVAKKCPFVNLPEAPNRPHALTAEEMKECIWVRPKLEAEVEYVNRTAGGRLRHPKFRWLP